MALAAAELIGDHGKIGPAVEAVSSRICRTAPPPCAPWKASDPDGVKQSGLGREGGRVGIEEFLEYKYVAMPAP